MFLMVGLCGGVTAEVSAPSEATVVGTVTAAEHEVVRAEETGRAAGEGAQRVHRRVEDCLGPDRRLDIGRERGRQATGGQQVGHSLREGRIAAETRFIGTDGEGRKDAGEIIALLRAASDPAQRLSIDEEVYLPLPGGAIYTFRSKRRGDRGFIDRGSVTQHLILIVEIEGQLKIAAAHSISTVD